MCCRHNICFVHKSWAHAILWKLNIILSLIIPFFLLRSTISRAFTFFFSFFNSQFEIECVVASVRTSFSLIGKILSLSRATEKIFVLLIFLLEFGGVNTISMNVKTIENKISINSKVDFGCVFPRRQLIDDNFGKTKKKEEKWKYLNNS